MCRLYGFRATEPSKVECTLVHSQNALMAQSRADLAGKSHAHGWGLATYMDHEPYVERQAWAAYHGEHFERAAARAYSRLAIAHIRRATVGEPKLENTHPFVHGPWVFVHNGTVPNFKAIAPRLLEQMTPRHRAAIRGDTDSEHVFRYAMSLIESGAVDMRDGLNAVLRRVGRDLKHLADEAAPGRALGFNVILTDGTRMAGTRLGRSLSYIVREGLYDCEICGFPHIHHDPGRSYRAVVVASEPLTHEAWEEIPEASLWEVDEKVHFSLEALRDEVTGSLG